MKMKTMFSLMASLLIFTACTKDSGKETDQKTGESVARTCHDYNGYTPSYSVSAYRTAGSDSFVSIQPFSTLSVSQSTSKKLITVYNRVTCDTYIWEDHYVSDGINLSVDLDSDWFGLLVSQGRNEIEYVIQTCSSVSYQGGVYTCVGEGPESRGTFNLMVQ